MKFNIFISYSRQDLTIVEKIKNEIEFSINARCWMDINGIESGAIQFTNDIVEGIKSCQVFLFMLSAHSQHSEFALRELHFAYNKAREDKKKVVIVNIDNCKMMDEFSFMYGLTDTINWNDTAQHNKLIRDLKRWIGDDNNPNVQKLEKRQPIQKHSYGVLMIDAFDNKIVSNQIKKSDPIIIERVLHAGTISNNQASLEIDLYQNDSDEDLVNVEKCIFLGKKELTLGLPVPAGTPVDIILSRDENGTIKAMVVCKDVRVSHILVPGQ